MTYLFFPLVIILMLAVPTLVVWSYIHVTRDGMALRAMAESDRDEAKLIELVRNGPVRSLEGMPVRDVDHLDPPDYRGFAILSDGHILDLRRHGFPVISSFMEPEGEFYQYRHFLVRKNAVRGADEHLRFQFRGKSAKFRFRCANSDLQPVLKRMRLDSSKAATRESMYLLELDLDFSKIANGATVDVVAEGLLENDPDGEHSRSRLVPHTSYGETKTATMWILVPQHWNAERLELIAYDRNKPEEQRSVRPTRQFEALGGAVLGWQIIGPEPDTTYEGHFVLN